MIGGPKSRKRGMTEIGIDALDSRLRKQAEKAIQAIEQGIFPYGIGVCTAILKRHPECLEVRKWLRKAQIGSAPLPKSPLRRTINRITGAPFVLLEQASTKNDPIRALHSAERLLTSDPRNATALKMLAQAADSLQLKRTAVFAREAIEKEKPENVPNLLALGRGYVDLDRGNDAVRVGETILERDPSREEALQLIKTASVRESIRKGGWAQKGDNREKLIRNVESEVPGNPAPKEESAGSIMETVAAIQHGIEREPRNFELLAEMIRLCEQLNDNEGALAWVGKARELPEGQINAFLDDKEVELGAREFECCISAKEELIKKSLPNRELEDELEQERIQLLNFRVERARDLVARYPNDEIRRLKFGKLLFEIADYEAAARQFQLLRQNPRTRLEAVLFLGRSFRSDRKFDLAVDQFVEAEKETDASDPLGKAVLYELAECYEQMGDSKRALSELKKIYSVDLALVSHFIS